jgi:hypothetical protein
VRTEATAAWAVVGEELMTLLLERCRRQMVVMLLVCLAVRSAGLTYLQHAAGHVAAEAGLAREWCQWRGQRAAQATQWTQRVPQGASRRCAAAPRKASPVSRLLRGAVGSEDGDQEAVSPRQLRQAPWLVAVCAPLALLWGLSYRGIVNAMVNADSTDF